MARRAVKLRQPERFTSIRQTRSYLSQLMGLVVAGKMSLKTFQALKDSVKLEADLLLTEIALGAHDQESPAHPLGTRSGLEPVPERTLIEAPEVTITDRSGEKGYTERRAKYQDSDAAAAPEIQGSLWAEDEKSTDLRSVAMADERSSPDLPSGRRELPSGRSEIDDFLTP